MRVSGLLKKGASKTIKNEVKEQKVEFFRVLLGALSASLLRNLLTGKSIINDHIENWKNIISQWKMNWL